MGYRVEGIPYADEYVPPVSLPKKIAPRTKRKSINFDATVWAIAEVMVQPLAKSRPAEEIAPVSAFLLETHSKMPDYMRLSIRILTLLFDAWSYPIKGKPFHRLPLSQRIDQVAAWENSRLEFRHGLIVFYRSFATFGLYSILYGQDYEWSECRERN